MALAQLAGRAVEDDDADDDDRCREIAPAMAPSPSDSSAYTPTDPSSSLAPGSMRLFMAYSPLGGATVTGVMMALFMANGAG